MTNEDPTGQPPAVADVDDGNGSQPTAAEVAEGLGKPDFDSAIQRNAATFTQLARAYFYSLEPHNDDEVDRLVNMRYFDPLSRAFENAEGAADSYWCENIIAAAALTIKRGDRRLKLFRRSDRYRLHSVNNETNQVDRDILDLLADLDRLAIIAATQLKNDDLR